MASGPVAGGQEEGLNPQQIGILQLNNMTYKLEPDLAVVVQRNVQSSFFLSQSYAPGSTMVCVVNSGSSFVNLRQSYLVMDVQNTTISTTPTATFLSWFGSNGGSAANFINRIQIIGKNGVILERIDNANVLAAAKVAYKYGSDWVSSVGQLMGMYPTAAALNWTYPGGSVAGVSTVRFMIPLYVFSTFCDEMGALCPAQLLSGARFEILLESPTVAMMTGTSGQSAVLTAAQNYSVTACRIDFESYLLTDSVLRVLNQTAASQGLEVVSSTTQDTQAQRVSSALTLDVARSCSRALQVLYKERIPKSATLPASMGAANDFDSMASAPLGTSAAGTYINIPLEWQARAGQLYFPQTSIRGAGGSLGLADNDLYLQTLRAFQKLNVGSMGQNASCNASLANYRGIIIEAVGSASSGGKGCNALDLQRSSILTSGIPLSNSRQLSIFYNTQFAQPAAFAYLVDCYLTYQILVRTFLSQAVLEV